MYVWDQSYQSGHMSLIPVSILLAMTACATTGAVSADAHKRQVIHRYFDEVWNRGQLDVLDELLAPDYVNHSSSLPDSPRGPSGVKPIVTAMRKAFPDLHYTIEKIVIGPDAVAVRTRMSGTFTGDLFGLPPTGKRFEVTQMTMEEFLDGKIVAHWRNTDELAMLKQLGVIP